MPPVITLLTDFGYLDPYVAIMKGQILKRAPETHLVDLSHGIPPQDVRTAGFHLEQSASYFPDGTIHLAVVDPGVGTSRAILAAATQAAFFIAPDNGLLTRALRRLGPPTELVRLPVPNGSASTFHGRDVMAPAAALLAAGVPLRELGTPAPGWVELVAAEAVVGPDSVQAEVLAVDHFGNVFFDLPHARGHERLLPCSRWSLEGQELVVGRTYADAEPGEPLLLWSSHGLLELACRDGRADSRWGLVPGQTVEMLAVNHR